MIFFVLSYLAIVRVFRENTFAASTIAVEPGQKLISKGPHAHVRHPMYAAGILLLAASPLSFGSWWGLTVFIPLFWRLLDEEKFLKNNLTGYAEYCSRVRARLAPLVW
jgi:protein-S-isoprenylcysteine O-methyltransferase Ste14